MSVLRTGRGRTGGGGGGVEFLTEKKMPLRNVPGVLKREKINCFKNVPGVLKRMHKIIYFSGGGGDFGVFGAPHAPHPGVARGRKTIHFFL